MSLSFFFFNDTATTEIYTLSLHDALPDLAGHRHELALALLVLDELHLRLRRRLREEVVNARLAGDGRRGARVVAGDHHRADPHGPEAREPLSDAALHHVLQVDEPEKPCAIRHCQRRPASVGERPPGLDH